MDKREQERRKEGAREEADRQADGRVGVTQALWGQTKKRTASAKRSRRSPPKETARCGETQIPPCAAPMHH